jgi:lambda family phage portal protein
MICSPKPAKSARKQTSQGFAVADWHAVWRKITGKSDVPTTQPAPQSMQLARRSFAFEASAHNRETFGWRSTRGSSNADNLASVATLRERSRQACRDQPLAKRGISLLANAILGEAGLQPRFSAIADEGLRAAASELWKDWAALCDNVGNTGLLGVEHTLFHSMYESGAGMLRFWFQEPQPATVPLMLQPFEPDFLASTWQNSQVRPGNRLYGGIEVDGQGRVVAYHLFRDHPGDTWTAGRTLSVEVDRIAADEIAHVYLSTRPQQLFGVPALHAALLPMRILDDYQDADLARLRAQATLVAIVQGQAAPQASSVTHEDPGGFGTLIRDGRGNTIETLEPGSIYYTDGAEHVTLTKPDSDPNYPKTVEAWTRLVAVAIGVQYTDLSGDLSSVNYSSYRAGHLTQRADGIIQRAAYIHPRFCVPLWRHWRTAAATVDRAMLALPRTISWTEPKLNSVDPMKDAQANRELIASGQMALSHAIERSGNDPAEVFAALGADKAALDELGLTVTSILTAQPQSATMPGAEP